jgi:LuxR family maltose regulon positive regulatory protein
MGNLAAALNWAEEHQGIIKGNEPLPYLREAGNIAVARVLVAAGRGEAALELLDRLHTSAQDGGRVGALIQIRVLQALAQNGLGESHTALKNLDQALALAEPEEYVRSIIDEGAGVAALLVETVARRQTAYLNYAIRLLSAMGYAADPHTHTVQLSEIPTTRNTGAQAGYVGTLVEPLTEREMEVLVCLARGMTNSEIADQLVVAVSTVKRHINHVFSKLGVTSRAKAIIEARKLGLL